MAKGCYCKKNEKWPASRTNIGIHGPRKDSSFRDEMLSALLKVSQLEDLVVWQIGFVSLVVISINCWEAGLSKETRI